MTDFVSDLRAQVIKVRPQCILITHELVPRFGPSGSESGKRIIGTVLQQYCELDQRSLDQQEFTHAIEESPAPS